MRAKVVVVRAVAGGLGMILGCLGTDAFLCESDQACQQGGVTGLCQPSGYCSFPDDECESGHRYGAHAGGSLSGTCVGLEPLTGDTGTSDDGVGTSPLGTSTSASTSTTGVTSLTTLPPTTDDGVMTTAPVDDSGTDDTTGPSTNDEDGPPATTTGASPEVVCWYDDFEDGVIGGEWCPWSDAGISIDEPDSHLRFTLMPEEWPPGSGGTGQAGTCEWVPLLDAEATTEVVAVPQLSPHTEAFIEIGNHDVRLGLGVLGGELYAFVWDGVEYGSHAFQPYDAAAHHYLRVRGTEEGLVAESSPDRKEWAHVYTHPVDLADTEGWAALGAWGEMAPLVPDEASFENFELCWLQQP